MLFQSPHNITLVFKQITNFIREINNVINMTGTLVQIVILFRLEFKVIIHQHYSGRRGGGYIFFTFLIFSVSSYLCSTSWTSLWITSSYLHFRGRLRSTLLKQLRVRYFSDQSWNFNFHNISFVNWEGHCDLLSQ